jgi:hypothetical protein
MALLEKAEQTTNQQDNTQYIINYSTSIVNNYLDKIIELLKK